MKNKEEIKDYLQSELSKTELASDLQTFIVNFVSSAATQDRAGTSCPIYMIQRYESMDVGEYYDGDCENEVVIDHGGDYTCVREVDGEDGIRELAEWAYEHIYEDAIYETHVNDDDDALEAINAEIEDKVQKITALEFLDAIKEVEELIYGYRELEDAFEIKNIINEWVYTGEVYLTEEAARNRIPEDNDKVRVYVNSMWRDHEMRLFDAYINSIRN